MLKRIFPLAFMAACLAAGTALAARVPSSKVERTANSGSRIDVTVPYLTNGPTTLGVAQGVAPRIDASPTLNSPKEPTGRPVFNLIFYGAQKGSSPAMIHATQRKPNNLRGN